MKTTNNLGSYDLKTRHVKEVDRLALQAELCIELERDILRRNGLKPGMKVLDLACGNGFISNEMAKIVQGGTVTGLDMNEELLQKAREAYCSPETAPHNLNFEQGDIYALPYAADTFDFVYARLLFQHVSDPALVLAQVHRVLKPNGIIALLDVDDDWLTIYPPVREFDLLKSEAAHYQAEQGGDRFVGRKMPEMLRAAGFRKCLMDMQLLSSPAIGMHNFLQITTSFKYELMPADLQAPFRLMQENMILELTEGDYTAYMGAFIATGIK